jgi:hypothetical protein
MRSRVFPVAIIFLLTPICFVSLQTPHLTQPGCMKFTPRKFWDDDEQTFDLSRTQRYHHRLG